jgi:type II secretory pathway component GspD/PulD (secretin)
MECGEHRRFGFFFLAGRHKDDAMFRKLSLFVVLGMFGLPAFAADPEPKPDAKDERARIRTFPLKKVEVSDALEAFNALTGSANAVQTRPATPAPLQDPRSQAPQPIGMALPTINLNSSSSASPTVAKPDHPVIVCRAVGDPRTRSLIVRGLDKDVQLAADLIAILDTPDNKPLPDVKSLKAFRLQHLDANDLVGIMEKLNPNLNYHLVAIGRLKLVLARGNDEQMSEVAEAVKELDIPATTK